MYQWSNEWPPLTNSNENEPNRAKIPHDHEAGIIVATRLSCVQGRWARLVRPAQKLVFTSQISRARQGPCKNYVYTRPDGAPASSNSHFVPHQTTIHEDVMWFRYQQRCWSVQTNKHEMRFPKSIVTWKLVLEKLMNRQKKHKHHIGRIAL